MGCYGIGVNRIIAAAVESSRDEDGIVWPISIAPYEVLITGLDLAQKEVAGTCEALYRDLAAEGLDILYDDRDIRAGVKFKDADLVGVPIRVTIGARGLKEGTVEVRRRDTKETGKVKKEEALRTVTEMAAAMHAALETQ